MAKMNHGLFGALSGNVGTVVVYTWRGKPCVRSKPSTVANPRTERQVNGRVRFATLMRMASVLRVALRRGMHREALQQGITESNLFVRLNHSVVDVVGGKAQMDYGALRLSYGCAPDVVFEAPQPLGGNSWSVAFCKADVDAALAADSLVQICAYCPSEGVATMVAPVPTYSHKCRIELPSHWQGVAVHLYGWVELANGQCSTCQYIGCVGTDSKEKPVAVVGTTTTGNVVDERPEADELGPRSEQSLDSGTYVRHGYSGLETTHHTAIAVDEKLGKVPLNVGTAVVEAVLGTKHLVKPCSKRVGGVEALESSLALEPLPHGRNAVAIDVHLGHLHKRDTVGASAEGMNVGIAARGLCAKLVARKVNNFKSTTLKAVVDLLQGLVLWRKTALCGSVDHQHHFATQGRHVERLAIGGQG